MSLCRILVYHCRMRTSLLVKIFCVNETAKSELRESSGKFVNLAIYENSIAAVHLVYDEMSCIGAILVFYAVIFSKR